MSLPEGLAEVIAQSNKALAETLAGAFQNLKYQRAPSIKLAKFHGTPHKPGDPTLKEWLNDVDTYARQLGLSGKELVTAAIDHLGSEAKEEVLCCPADQREDFKGLSALLSRRFDSPATVQSLNASFYGRTQGDGESLAEYSRALMRLYSHMESVAEGSAQQAALTQLRENALRGQLINGVRDLSVRRELRRLTMDRPDISFYDLREVALHLFPDSSEEKEDVDLCAIERKGGRNTKGAEGPIPSETPMRDNQKLLSELLEGQKQLQTAVELLVKKQASMTTQLQSVADALQSRPVGVPSQRKYSRGPVTCTFCQKQGHVEEKCFKRKHAQTSNTLDATKPVPSSGNAPPPS